LVANEIVANVKIHTQGEGCEIKAKGVFMREELKALGLADDLVNAVMVLHGKRMTEVTNKATAAEQESATAKAELKKYQKGGEFHIDAKEHERLKTFEKDTLSKAEREAKTVALTKLYKGANASDSAIKLLLKGHNFDEIELNEKGEVKNGAELLNTAKADYADLFGANGNRGVEHAPNDEDGVSSTKKRQTIY
jgi:hypothetical protein